jgi:hypothetical protein
MAGGTSQGSLAQRTETALSEALRRTRSRRSQRSSEQRVRRLADLLIEGIHDDQLPQALDRHRQQTPDSATALALNTFVPWQRAAREMPLAGYNGFQAMQFDVRCPTGLRGTPPHLNLLALRDEVAVAVTVRCSEYLARRKSPVAPSYDRLLDETQGLEPWRRHLEALRASPKGFALLDLGALIKYALALGRTFPDRRAVLLYLYWEPIDADSFAEFRQHRYELERLSAAIADGRIGFRAQTFEALWSRWAERDRPSWIGQHVARLRSRYNVALGQAGF